MGIPIYLLVAYGVFWTLTFVLVISMWARQRRLEQELAALEAQLGERGESAG
jgi:CcmD family protein